MSKIRHMTQMPLNCLLIIPMNLSCSCSAWCIVHPKMPISAWSLKCASKRYCQKMFENVTDNISIHTSCSTYNYSDTSNSGP